MGGEVGHAHSYKPLPEPILTQYGNCIWKCPWWRHQKEHIPRNWPFVRGIHRLPMNSPHKGQWRGALICSMICAWINGWVNNRDADDLRRHHTHYDTIVMYRKLRSSWLAHSVSMRGQHTSYAAVSLLLSWQWRQIKPNQYHSCKIFFCFGYFQSVWENTTI